MTNEEARKILLAKIKCIETQLSGRADCVMRVCNKCDCDPEKWDLEYLRK